MTAINPGSGELSSYNIKDSYVGILRLSPNNSISLLEKDNHEGYEENSSNYIIYEDTVADTLASQLVKVSTSDGILLDLRLGTNTVEFDNLYVLGTVKAKSIVTYGTLSVNGKSMPSLYNANNKAATATPVQSTPITKNNYGDAYILVNTAADGEPPVFEYKNARTIVHSLIERNVRDLSFLPTGSIHWIPVSLEQYNELLAAGHKHNSSKLGTNTLIRDFLLCDGSTYNNIDYPELAKILHGEKVTRWIENGDYMEPEEVISGENYTFTVPDLRSMFIEYLVPLIDKAKDPKNQTGYWEIDSCKHQELVIADGTDKHHHHIVLDNSSKYQSNTKTGDLDNDRPLAKYGSMGSGGWQTHGANNTKGCNTRNCKESQTEIASAIYPPKDLSGYCRLSTSTCGYILSANYQENPTINFGLSSPANKKESFKPSNDMLNYTKDNSDLGLYKETHRRHRDVYKTTKNYASYHSDEYLDLIGKENTPEFFALLPLIKI